MWHCSSSPLDIKSTWSVHLHCMNFFYLWIFSAKKCQIFQLKFFGQNQNYPFVFSHILKQELGRLNLLIRVFVLNTCPWIGAKTRGTVRCRFVLRVLMWSISGYRFWFFKSDVSFLLIIQASLVILDGGTL